MTNRPVPDQRDLWIRQYGDAPQPQGSVSAFATDCLTVLPPQARILELGCGRGDDAVAFAQAGHEVIATDFVPAVIAAKRARHPNLEFREMRIDAPYPYPDASFDAVYAHLTLHYYRDDVTRSILREIHRVLRPGGWVLFACKSPQDPAWGQGVEMEPDMFDLDGKVRHFFSDDYARNLLADAYTDTQVTSHRGELYRQPAGWITVTAHRNNS